MGTKYVSVLLDDRLYAYLARMAKTGIYPGADVEDVVMHLCADGVQQAIGRGLIPPAPDVGLDLLFQRAFDLGAALSRGIDGKDSDAEAWLVANRSVISGLADAFEAAAEGSLEVPAAPKPKKPTGPNCAHTEDDDNCPAVGCLGEIPF